MIGSSASTTPIGSATYWMWRSGSSSITPTVRLVLEEVPQELGRDVVLDHLVLEDAEAGLLHRQLGELDRALEPGDDHRPDDAVHGLLVEPPQLVRRGLRALHEAVQARGLLGVDRAVGWVAVVEVIARAQDVSVRGRARRRPWRLRIAVQWSSTHVAPHARALASPRHDRPPDAPRRHLPRAGAGGRVRAHAHRRRARVRSAARRVRAVAGGGARAPRPAPRPPAALPAQAVGAAHRRAAAGRRGRTTSASTSTLTCAAPPCRPRAATRSCATGSATTGPTGSTATGRCGRSCCSTGLEGGRWALVTKTHHSMVDGVGSVDAGYLMLDSEPEPAGAAGGLTARRRRAAPALGRRGASLARLAARRRPALDARACAARRCAAARTSRSIPHKALEMLERSRATVDVLLRDEVKQRAPLVAELRDGRDAQLRGRAGAARRPEGGQGEPGRDRQRRRARGRHGRPAAAARREGGGASARRACARWCPMNVRQASEKLALGNRISSLFVHLPVAADTTAERYRQVMAEAETLKTGDAGGRDVDDHLARRPRATRAPREHRPRALRDAPLQRDGHERARAADDPLRARRAAARDHPAGAARGGARRRRGDLLVRRHRRLRNQRRQPTRSPIWTCCATASRRRSSR